MKELKPSREAKHGIVKMHASARKIIYPRPALNEDSVEGNDPATRII